MTEKLHENTRTEIESLIYSHQKMAAIKVLREAQGLGLKESKEAIEKMSRDLSEQNPEKFSANSKTGCGSAIIIAFAFLTALGYAAHELAQLA